MLKSRLDQLRRRVVRRNVPVLAARAGYDLWAATYAEKMNPVQVLEAEALDRMFPPTRGATILDAGCGKGRCASLALERHARKAVGIDLSAAMLRSASRAIAAPSGLRVQGDVTGLPFAAASFDIAFCSLTLGHVADLERAIDELARVLRRSGSLLVSGFHPFATLRGWQRTFEVVADGRTYAIEQHLHLFEDYVRCFDRAGLVVEALEEPRYEGLPLVFVLRARKVGVRREERFDVSDDDRPVARPAALSRTGR